MRKISQLSWSTLTAELRRREVYPVIVAYAVVAWLLLQIGEVTFGPLGFPEWVMTALIVLAILGFPVAVFLAWRYDVTPIRILRDSADSNPHTETEGQQSVAVLPFIDLSPAQDQKYFCEGVAEEIVNALSHIRQLRVAARSSSFQYSSEAGDVREIGHDLGVNAILEGSVRKSDGTLRITAQLVNVTDGYHFWSKSYDRQLEDVFAVQHEIASNIAVTLLQTLTPRERVVLRRPRSTDAVAYDFYLQGRQHFKRFRKDEIERAQEMFLKAIGLDPQFPLAWAGYADCHSFLAMYADPNPDYVEQAHTASKRAVALSPDLAEARASRGLACLASRDYERAEEELQQALEINPNLFEAYYYLGRVRFHQGDMAKAARLFQLAAEIDPTDYQSRCLRVQILRGSGQVEQAKTEAEEAVAVIQKNLKWNPDDARGLHLGAGALLLLGRKDEARQWLRRALENHPDDPILLYNLACHLATLNEVDEALDYLDRAFEHGTINADWMRNDEDLANLRGNPHYGELLQRLEHKGCEHRS